MRGKDGAPGGCARLCSGFASELDLLLEIILVANIFAICFSLFAGAIFGGAVIGTAFFFRQNIDSPTWLLAATAGIWVTSVFVIILFQNLAPPGTARILVPALLILLSIIAIWNSIRMIRRM